MSKFNDILGEEVLKGIEVTIIYPDNTTEDAVGDVDITGGSFSGELENPGDFKEFIIEFIQDDELVEITATID